MGFGRHGDLKLRLYTKPWQVCPAISIFETVFEVLPVKNYNLSRIVHFSQSTRSKIITQITKSLKDSAPDIGFEIDIFHPAALISTALGIEYMTSPYRDPL